MGRIRTTNLNRKRALRRKVYAEGFAYHQARTRRLMQNGDVYKAYAKLMGSRFARKQRKRIKLERVMTMNPALAAGYDPGPHVWDGSRYRK